MKKTNTRSRIDDLMVDVIEFAFIEWLVRRGVLSAFKANFEPTSSPRATFREHLRVFVRNCFYHPTLGVGDLICSAFLFTSTPEGFAFWSNKSNDWKRFCGRFQAKF